MELKPDIRFPADTKITGIIFNVGGKKHSFEWGDEDITAFDLEIAGAYFRELEKDAKAETR